MGLFKNLPYCPTSFIPARYLRSINLRKLDRHSRLSKWTAEFATDVKRYKLREVVRDRYGADWVRERFKQRGLPIVFPGNNLSSFHGITYRDSMELPIVPSQFKPGPPGGVEATWHRSAATWHRSSRKWHSRSCRPDLARTSLIVPIVFAETSYNIQTASLPMAYQVRSAVCAPHSTAP